MTKVLLAILTVSVLAATSFAQPHEGDVVVGRSAANQLKIDPDAFVPDDSVEVLPPSSGLFNGWSGTEPGFDHVVDDEPANDLYSLETGCQVRLELVQADAAFRAITTTFAIIDDPGEQALLGGATLHTHLTWHVNSDHPGFDPLKVLWRATFKLVDTGSTGYGASSEFTYHFATVDCLRGDCNGDSVLDARDIPGFLATVLDPAAHADVERCRADADRDGLATVDDVSSFVTLLLSRP